MTDRLSRFTPNGSGLDRDAILFAAGQQAARGSWVWKAVAGLLAGTQVMTLIVLWPRDVQPAPAPLSVPAVAPLTEPAPPSPPSDIWTVRSSPDLIQSVPTAASGEFVSPGPTLTVGSGYRFD
jgi:hypothetical protein